MKQVMMFGGLLVLIGAVFTGVALWLMPHGAALNGVSASMCHYWWAFALWRYALLGTLVWKWPKLCQWFGAKNQWSQESIVLASQKRWWVLVMIILFEVVIVYGL